MKYFFYTIVLFVITTIFSCDKVDDPFPPNEEVADTGIVWDDSVIAVSNNGTRYVLMEEYTGHKCTNCPRGARRIKDIKDVWGNKFIPIATHVIDAFSAPGPIGGPEGSYIHDFRTEEGKEYESSFSIAGLPGGLVNRNFPIVADDSKWETQTNDVLNDATPAIANLHLTAYFDDADQNNDNIATYKIRIVIEWLSAYTSGLNLQAQMVEDHIIDWQLDLGQHIPDYDHRHMFRGSVNGEWGESLTESAAVGQKDTITYTRLFEPVNNAPDGVDIVPENVTLVVFLYKDQSDGYEVMQVNEVHLMHP